MTEGFYYLHVNGELIFKRNFEGIADDLRDSDLVVDYWAIDPEDRTVAWRLLVEALACGAKLYRVTQLAEFWHCTDADALVYASKEGFRLFKDGDSWCATRTDFSNLQESPAGFGPTCLEATADLCKKLGYRPSKVDPRRSFPQLLRKTPRFEDVPRTQPCCDSGKISHEF